MMNLPEVVLNLTTEDMAVLDRIALSKALSALRCIRDFSPETTPNHKCAVETLDFIRTIGQGRYQNKD